MTSTRAGFVLLSAFVATAARHGVGRAGAERDSPHCDADLDLHLHGPAAHLRLRS